MHAIVGLLVFLFLLPFFAAGFAWGWISNAFQAGILLAGNAILWLDKYVKGRGGS